MTDELKNKIEKALSSEIICEIEFTDDEIDELRIYLMDAIDKFNDRGSKYFYKDEIKMLIILIVHYSKSWGDGNESRFWVRILGDIFEKTVFTPNNKFYDEVEKVLSLYNKKLFISPSGKRMLRETLLFHAMAPRISITSFIKLLFNCCVDEDFINRSYMNDKDIYAKIAKGLEKRFSKTITNDMDNDIEFDGNSYSVRSGIKYACIQEQKTVVSLIEQIMSCIDAIIFENQDVDNSVIGKHVSNTIHSLWSQTKTIKNKKANQNLEPIVSDFSKIYTYYEIVEDKPVLSVPEILIFDDDMTEGTISLYYEDNLIEKRDFNIIGHGFKRKVKKISFNVLNYSDRFVDSIKFRIKVYINGSNIYDSKESAYRKYIILNQNTEIKRDCKPGCYFLVYPNNIKLQEITDAQIQGINKSFAAITSIENNYINYKDKTIFFNNKKLNSHLFIDGIEICNTKLIVDEDTYQVFNKINTINLVLNDYKSESIIYKINNKLPISLSANNVIKNGNQYLIKLDEKDLSDINQIRFYDIKTSKVIEYCNFAIFSKLKVRFDKDFYFGNSSGSLFVYDNGEEIAYEKVNGGTDEISFKYKNIGQMVITCPNIKFNIDDGKWNWACITKDIWHKTLHSGSVLNVLNNTDFNIGILCNDSTLKVCDENSYLLGDIIAKNIVGDKKIYMEVNGQRFNLFTITFSEKIIGNPEFVYENALIIHDLESKFIGDNDAKFEIELLNGNDDKFVYKFGLYDLIEAPDLKEDYYTYRLYLIHEGLYDNTKQLLFNYDDYMIALGNVYKFEYQNSIIKILNTKTPIKRVKFDNCFIDNINYKEEDFYPVYTGCLHCNKTKLNIEFERKDENTLKIYVINNDSLKLINVDVNNAIFTTSNTNEKTIFECFSCYYKKEDR